MPPDCPHAVSHFAADQLGWICLRCGAYVPYDAMVRHHPLYTTDRATRQSIREALHDSQTPVNHDEPLVWAHVVAAVAAWRHNDEEETFASDVEFREAMVRLADIADAYLNTKG